MSNITEGAIGTLVKGEKQVGGFLAWEARVDMANLLHPRVLIAARGVWLFGDIDGEGLEAVLYSEVFGELVETARYTVEITSAPGDLPEDTLSYFPLEMVHNGT